MRFDGLDLNLLVALEVLLETRSTTQTAGRLNLSQPTISAALGRLRDYFDDDLLLNVGREMVPTPLGEELAPAVTELLNVARFRIMQGEGFVPATSRRRFKLVASDYAFDVLVAPVLARAAAEAPHVTFEIGPTGPEGMRLFLKGDVDVMVTVPNYVLDGHPSVPLFTDQDVVICWKEGKFAGGITAEQFLAADFATAVFGEEQRPTISELHFRDQQIAFNTCVQVASFSALPGAVCGTDRVALMHRRHAELFRRTFPIVLHPLPVQGAGIRELAQWHNLRRKDGGISWLIALMQSEGARLDNQDS